MSFNRKRKIEEMKKKSSTNKEIIKKEVLEKYRNLTIKVKDMGIPEKLRKGLPLTPAEQKMWEEWKSLHQNVKKAKELDKKLVEIKEISKKAQNRLTADPRVKEIVAKYEEVKKQILERKIPEKLKRGERLSLNELLLLQNFKNLKKTIELIEKMK